MGHLSFSYNEHCDLRFDVDHTRQISLADHDLEFPLFNVGALRPVGPLLSTVLNQLDVANDDFGV